MSARVRDVLARPPHCDWCGEEVDPALAWRDECGDYYCDEHAPLIRGRPDLCPMGCGRTTDDVAGGPCKRCWDAI